MKLSTDLSIKDLLLQDLSPGFIDELINQLNDTYLTAYDTSLGDPDLDKDQALYQLGYRRRALAETSLKRTAIKFGLSCKTIQPKDGGCSHISVSMGRFSLAMCHVQAPDAFPKYSVNREQTSKVNQHISQMSFWEEMPQQIYGEEIFGIIIHSGRSDKKALRSIRVGIPNADFTAWVQEPNCLFDLNQILQRVISPEDDLQAEIQQAEPRLKKEMLGLVKSAKRE